MTGNKIEIGIILQGGGALGAYEWGAINCLVKHNFVPKVVAGVSIGAINAAAIAGAPDGDIIASLKNLWHAITLRNLPFVPVQAQALLSMFGNPAFWSSRMDVLNAISWTSLCEVSPMRKTLIELIDFERLNDNTGVRIGVNATNVCSGKGQQFSSNQTTLTADHILASGALPPNFPAVEIDGELYWDGGLSSNTPIQTLFSLMKPYERLTMPVFCLDLFPSGGNAPTNLFDVQSRITEIHYQNRLGARIQEFRDIVKLMPTTTTTTTAGDMQLATLIDVMQSIHIVKAQHQPLAGAIDFSEFGVKQLRDSGYRAMAQYLADNHDKLIDQAAKYETAKALAATGGVTALKRDAKAVAA